MTQRNHAHDHALVIGGSMAGLFAARVLSDHFKRVTIIDRDELPDSAEFRNGVPQTRHLHQLLIRGQRIMERLFPSLLDDMAEIGAPRIEWGYNTLAAGAGGFVAPVHTGMYSNTLSRAGLEYLIRRRIKKLPNVEICGGSVVTRLLTNADKTVITGVRVEQRPAKSEVEFTADLVVDASGRRSETPIWLESLGFEQPPITHIDAHVGYASCWFEKPAYAPKDVVMMLVKAHPTTHRAGLISTVEGNRWTVILTSNNKDYPPTDYDGFLEFARSLQSPLIYNYIKDAKPITQVFGYRNTDNIWHHYEKMPRRPEHLIVTGDAACGFNPIYGQGMSVAAMDAELLDALLKDYAGRDLSGFADDFQKRLAKTVEIPFALATADDLQQPTVEVTRSDAEKQSWLLKQIGLYFRALIAVTDADPVVFTQFLKVMNMIDEPKSLLTPPIMLRVARYYLRRKHSLNPTGHLGVTLAPEVG